MSVKATKSKRVNWRTLSPGTMAEKSIFNYLIREAGVEVILLTSLKADFLRPMADDNGEEFWEIDWEYILFKATEHQRTKFAEFYGKWREDKKKPKIEKENLKAVREASETIGELIEKGRAKRNTPVQYMTPAGAEAFDKAFKESQKQEEFLTEQNNNAKVLAEKRRLKE